MSARTLLLWALRLGLAGLFIGAAGVKIIHPAEFALAIFRYHLLPDGLVNLAAIFMPWLELWTGMALLCVPRLRTVATLMILVLLLLFTAAIGISLARGLNIACGCFSVDPDAARIGWWSVVRNTGFILLALLHLVLDRPAAGRTSPA